MKMIYIHKNGERIVFDDYTKDYDGDERFYWAEMCPKCYNRFKAILEGREDDGGTAAGICSVYGCDNEADYYVDFSHNDVDFTE